MCRLASQCKECSLCPQQSKFKGHSLFLSTYQQNGIVLAFIMLEDSLCSTTSGFDPEVTKSICTVKVAQLSLS